MTRSVRQIIDDGLTLNCDISDTDSCTTATELEVWAKEEYLLLRVSRYTALLALFEVCRINISHHDVSPNFSYVGLRESLQDIESYFSYQDML